MEESSEQLIRTFCIPQNLINTRRSLHLTAGILCKVPIMTQSKIDVEIHTSYKIGA